MIAAIIAAAGSGERFGAAIPKALIQLGDRTLIEHAVSAISSVADQIIVTAPSGYEKEIQKFRQNKVYISSSYLIQGNIIEHTFRLRHPTHLSYSVVSSNRHLLHEHNLPHLEAISSKEVVE